MTEISESHLFLAHHTLFLTSARRICDPTPNKIGMPRFLRPSSDQRGTSRDLPTRRLERGLPGSGSLRTEAVLVEVIGSFTRATLPMGNINDRRATWAAFSRIGSNSRCAHRVPRFQRRHPAQTNSIFHNPEQFAVRISLYFRRCEVCGTRVHPAASVSWFVTIEAVTRRAFGSKKLIAFFGARLQIRGQRGLVRGCSCV